MPPTITTQKLPAAKALAKRRNERAVARSKKKTGTAVAVHKPQQPKSMLELIADAARDPKVDVGKMRELLKMKQEEEDRRAEVLFNNALADAKEKIPVVVKDGKGDRSITYAKLETVSRAIDPIIKENGFVISYGMADSPKIDHYRITAELRHRAGYKKEYFADIPPSTTGPQGKPIMTVTQGAGSAISFGRRYLKLMIFDITIVGEDDNGAGGPREAINESQLAELKARMAEANIDEEAFCTAFQIKSVEALPRDKLETALGRIAQKYAAMA